MNKRCPWANALGVPREGVHSTRIFGYAAFDVIGTVAIALIITYIWGWSWRRFVEVCLSAFATGIALHYIFGVDTVLNVQLFGYACTDD